jgi:tRNA nucleotidyltransferase (CCA-adding enzyme)
MVAQRIERGGGRALLVGGSVIDLLCGRAAKDWDIEVFGLDFDQITALFPDHPIKEAGRAFGILKLAVDGVDVDINVPRTDNSVGKGHKDFVVEVDPTMSVREAARRRDFTINTLAMDATGEVVDEWGGMRDLEDGILRATDPELFVQDPLRALRAMQLLPRKARIVAPGTMSLIRGMVDEFEHLPPERVFEEWRKLLLKADKPSIGLEFLVDSGWIKHFPELGALRGVGQHPDWHPEGDVWVHSLLAVDAAAELRGHLPGEDRELVAFSALLHDVGKLEKTITPAMVAADEAPADMLWTAHGHDRAGMEPADRFMQRITGPDGMKKLRRQVGRLVGEHMQPWGLTSGEAKQGAWARLHRRLAESGLTLHHLAAVCRCDSCATGVNWRDRSLRSGEPNWEHETSQRVLDWAGEFENAPPDPKVQGRDLIARGMKPGREFGVLLAKCLELQDTNPTWGTQELLDNAIMEAT